jgi:hypothetical protein
MRGIRLELDLASQMQLYLGLWERELHPWVERLTRGAATAIDVGAAEGEYTLYFLRRPPLERVFAFEPLAEARSRLTQNAALNGVDSGRLVLSGDFVGAAPAPGATTLDSLAGVAEPVVIKVDVDGAEVDVLRFDTAIRAGDEESLRRAVELEPGRADAALALARLLMAGGDTAAALEVLGNVAGSFQAEALAARIRLEKAADLELDEALRAIDGGERERAVDLLLDAISTAGDYKDDLRRLIVGILDELGVEHPAAREGRRRLAAALY